MAWQKGEPPGFVRAHAECQYQFLKAISDDVPAAPTLSDVLHVQAMMEAAQQSSERGGWVSLDEVFNILLQLPVVVEILVPVMSLAPSAS